MTPRPLALVVSLALFSSAALAQQNSRAPVCNCSAQQCLPYEREVALVGRLAHTQGTDANGRRERFVIITAERSVCGQRTSPTAPDVGDFDLDEPDQTELQLHTPEPSVRAQIDRLARAGTRVDLRGRVWHAHTAHHHRALLFTVTSVTPTPSR